MEPWRLKDLFWNYNARSFTASNRAAGLEFEGFDDSYRFHGGGDACAVVGCAGAGVPGIHVRADHDDLVFEIAAGDFGDGVVGHGVGGVILHLQPRMYMRGFGASGASINDNLDYSTGRAPLTVPIPHSRE
jgi:hypothetical protein